MNRDRLKTWGFDSDVHTNYRMYAACSPAVADEHELTNASGALTLANLRGLHRCRACPVTLDCYNDTLLAPPNRRQSSIAGAAVWDSDGAEVPLELIQERTRARIRRPEVRDTGREARNARIIAMAELGLTDREVALRVGTSISTAQGVRVGAGISPSGIKGPRPRQPCGTPAGAARHRRRHEGLCEECRRAERRRTVEYRVRAGAT